MHLQPNSHTCEIATSVATQNAKLYSHMHAKVIFVIAILYHNAPASTPMRGLLYIIGLNVVHCYSEN